MFNFEYYKYLQVRMMEERLVKGEYCLSSSRVGSPPHSLPSTSASQSDKLEDVHCACISKLETQVEEQVRDIFFKFKRVFLFSNSSLLISKNRNFNFFSKTKRDMKKSSESKIIHWTFYTKRPVYYFLISLSLFLIWFFDFKRKNWGFQSFISERKREQFFPFNIDKSI